jgi:exodeoxyribonuclease V alpha subunit
MAELQTVSGIVKNLTFRNEENGYFVSRTDCAGREVMIVGNAPVIHPGHRVEARGTWERTKWGLQFKAVDVKVEQPTMLEGIRRYLSSGAIPNVGKKMADRMIDAFGAKVFEVIKNEPERLKEVEGIGKKRAQAIVDTYKVEEAVERIMVYLHENKMSASMARRVYQAFGAKAIEKIEDNPYSLCDIWGIGFRKADEVALAKNIPRESEFRLRAALRFVIGEASKIGSCGLPVQAALTAAGKLCDLPDFALDDAMRAEVGAKGLILDSAGGVECLFTPKVYYAEKDLAAKLYRLSEIKPRKPIQNIEEEILFAELDLGITLEKAQADAVRTALESQVCIITGGPGTGKTTITKTIVEILEGAGLSVHLAAPTGKAARRMSEVTGRPATTIHRMLGRQRAGEFEVNEHNQLETDVLVVDEASMVDVLLCFAVLKAVKFTTRLLIVGDVDQLPSVGAGKVLNDLIAAGVLPTVRLTQVFRQAATSEIVKTAHRVNSGQGISMGKKGDFEFLNPGVDEEDRTIAQNRIVSYVADMWKRDFDPIRDVQVLTPMRKGPFGSIELNVLLKEALNGTTDIRLVRGGNSPYTFSPGDKVMQLRNNYDKGVFNGDIGFILDVDVGARSITVDFDGRVIAYKSGELDEIDLAYAFTIHKSQGSEFPVVVMPFTTSSWMMLKRNLLYTGITRAKKLMVVMGNTRATRQALENSQVDERYSKLKDWMLYEARKAQREPVAA